MFSLEKLINEKKVLICAGSGGVGKTTISASLAVAAAEMGKRVLVLTIDPSRRLVTALGLKELSSKPERVSVPGAKGQLSAAVVNADEIFDDFVREASKTQESADKILKNRLYKKISTSLSGSQEFTSLEILHKSLASGGYDLVILDTPPAKHAVDFLRAPEKFYNLFDENILTWLKSSEKEKQGLIKKVLHRGTQKAIGILEFLVGESFLKEMFDFFDIIHDLSSVIQERSIAMQKLLTNSQTSFLVVTSYDEVKIQEANDFYKSLRREGYHLSGVILNRSFPLWLKNQSPQQDIEKNEIENKLFAYYQEMLKYIQNQQTAYEAMKKNVPDNVGFVALPEFFDDIASIESLQMISAELLKRSKEESLESLSTVSASY